MLKAMNDFLKRMTLGTFIFVAIIEIQITKNVFNGKPKENHCGLSTLFYRSSGQCTED